MSFFIMRRSAPRFTLFPYTTLFRSRFRHRCAGADRIAALLPAAPRASGAPRFDQRSEEHTSELQSRVDLVCRLLLENKNKVPMTWLHSRAAKMYALLLPRSSLSR